MAQLPLGFGGKKPEKGPSPPPPPARTTLSVAELLQKVRHQLEDQFRFVIVTGEISNYSINGRSGHAYFTLKDKQAQVRCALWRDHLRRVRFELKDGLEVAVRAKVTVFDRGDVHLSVVYVEPVGLGALQQEFLDRVEKLRREGLLAAARKRPIPAFPDCVGVVTSKNAAALRDVLRTLLRRNPSQAVIFAHSAVQGRGSAADIAEALRALDRLGRCELILLVRGGGSIEDLWAFNEESVARAIVSCSVPVITGVGHETDTTIADMVADLRASTPTAAAEHAVPVKRAVEAHVGQMLERLSRSARRHVATRQRDLLRLERRLRHPQDDLRRRAQRLDRLSLAAERRMATRLTSLRRRLGILDDRLKISGPGKRLAHSARRLDAARARLEELKGVLLADKGHRLALLASRLESLSPLGVLARGYALASDEHGHVLTRAADATLGQKLALRLSEGQLSVSVDAIEEGS